MANENGKESNKAGILCTEILNVQNKRYYFDVKEHEYGRFLKLAETAQSGRKSRLVIPMYLVPEVEKVLSNFEQELVNLPEFVKTMPNSPPSAETQENGSGDAPQAKDEQKAEASEESTTNAGKGSKQQNANGKRRGSRRGGAKGSKKDGVETEAAVDIKDDVIERGRRRYYFNMKENNRGRYLRVKAIGDIPSAMAGRSRRGGYNNRNSRNGRNNSGDAPRAIILPSSGLVEFREIITKLLKEYSVDPETDQVALADKNIEINGTANDKLPASQRFSSRSFRKVIFLDAGENSRGYFARMTELQSSYRECVTIPSRHFKAMGEWFLEAARVTADDNRENNRSSDSDVEHQNRENGSGDAKVINGGGRVNQADYDEDDDSSDLDVVANGNRRRQAASDSEE